MQCSLLDTLTGQKGFCDDRALDFSLKVKKEEREREREREREELEICLIYTSPSPRD